MSFNIKSLFSATYLEKRTYLRIFIFVALSSTLFSGFLYQKMNELEELQKVNMVELGGYYAKEYKLSLLAQRYDDFPITTKRFLVNPAVSKILLSYLSEDEKTFKSLKEESSHAKEEDGRLSFSLSSGELVEEVGLKDALGVLTLVYAPEPSIEIVNNVIGVSVLVLALILILSALILRRSFYVVVTEPIVEIIKVIDSYLNQPGEAFLKNVCGQKNKLISSEETEVDLLVTKFQELLTKLCMGMEDIRFIAKKNEEMSKSSLESLKRVREEVKKQKQLIIALSHDIKQPIVSLELALDLNKKWFLDDKDGLNKKEDLLRLYAYLNSLNQKAHNILDNAVFINDENNASFNSVFEEDSLFNFITSLDSVGLMPFDANNKGVAFTVDFGGYENAIVKLSGTKFKRILSNLCINAINYTAKGGEVTLKIKKIDVEKDEIVVAITDTGEGIEPELLSRLNDPNEKNNRNNKSETSLGFGVLNVHNYLKEDGGSLYFSSQKGVGTKAEFTMTAYLVEEKGFTFNGKALYVGNLSEKFIPALQHRLGLKVEPLNDEELLPDDLAEYEMVILYDYYKVNGTQYMPNRASKSFNKNVLKKVINTKGPAIVLLQNIINPLAIKPRGIREIMPVYDIYLNLEESVSNEEASTDFLSDTEKKKLDGIRLLIIDDDHKFAEVVGRQITAKIHPCSINITIVNSHNEALSVVKSSIANKSHYDVIFIDRMLGESTGEAVAADLRQIYPTQDRPVLIGFSAAEHKTDGNSGFDDFFLKNRENITKALRRVAEDD